MFEHMKPCANIMFDHLKNTAKVGKEIDAKEYVKEGNEEGQLSYIVNLLTLI